MIKNVCDCEWLKLTSLMLCIVSKFIFLQIYECVHILTVIIILITLIILDLLIIILFWSYCYTNYFLFFVTLVPFYKMGTTVSHSFIFIRLWLYYAMGLSCCHLLVENDFPAITLVLIDRCFILYHNRKSNQWQASDYSDWLLFFLADSQHYLEGI